jgi:hypothetical protein
MTTFRLVMAAALLWSGSSFAQGIEIGPGGVRVQPEGYGYGHHRHYGYAPDCRELRAACMHKEERGEQGRGNCRRYRELCQGGRY